MTLLEFVRELNELVEKDLTSAQEEVNLDATVIVLADNTCITIDEDTEDYFEDDVDETNYDPYMGCDFYEDNWGDDF